MASVKQDRRWIKMAVFLVGALAALSLRAEPGMQASGMEHADRKPAMCHGAEGDKGMDMMHGMMKQHHDKMAEELKLDDKQRALFDEAMTAMHGTMKDGMSLHHELKALAHSDTYDEKQVRALVQKHNAVMEEKTVTAANAMHAFHESLSPEQKARFKAMKSEMRDKMKAHMKDGMAGTGDADAAAVKQSNAEKTDDDNTGAPSAEHSHEH